jgi:tetratricopeptide (TPR) repeat protein
MSEESKYVKYEYNGQMLTMHAIAELEGVNDNVLRNRYKEENDIYKAVKLAKEAKQKEKDRISQIPYNGQILSLTAIAKLEGISHTNLTKKYKKANDIYEAVRLAKEGQTKRQESVTQIPYNGQILSLAAIAKLEGISGDTLTKKYEKTNDIHEAVKLAKEAKGTIEYKGEKRTLYAISKLEGVTYTTLIEKYEKTKDIQEAIRLTKEGHKKAEESISQIPYEDKILSFFTSSFFYFYGTICCDLVQRLCRR